MKKIIILLFFSALLNAQTEYNAPTVNPTVNSINGRYNDTSNLINEIYYNEQSAPTVKLKPLVISGNTTIIENIDTEYNKEMPNNYIINDSTEVRLSIFSSLNKSDSAQDSTWVRVFGDDINNVARSVIETYDHGYIIGGHIKPEPPATGTIKEGLIIKTNINGEILWKKVIGTDADNGVDGTQIVQTYDGGYILFSGTYKYGGNRNVMLMKLNACGEKEWNKIFISSYQSQWNVDLLLMNDSSYLAMLSYWGNDAANERIWLFKISQTGDIIWQKVYANWNPSTNNEDSRQLIVNNENEYLLTGKYYEYQPGGDTNARYRRPMFIKIDSLGNEIWHTLWGIDDFYVGWQAKSVFNNNGDIYSVGKNETIALIDDKPVMHKLSKNGDQLYYKNIEENSKAGGATTISILEDSVLFIGATWQGADDSVHIVVYKTDTMGNILAEKEIIPNSNSFNESIITHDNKLLIVGSFYWGGNYDIYLYKFNRNLGYDSIYTQPLVYDSLCPYQIISDTITLDTTTVNLDELYKQMHQMKVRPNPANNKLYFTLGDLAIGTKISLYNTQGIVVKQLVLNPIQKEYIMDISALPGGLYVAILHNYVSVIDRRKIILTTTF